MTETQLKQLATVVLNVDEKIDRLSEILMNVIEEKISEGGGFGRDLNSLSCIEQLSALNRDAAANREKIRTELGLQ